MKGLILALILCVVSSTKIVHRDFPKLGEYCVISENLFWRPEELKNPNQYYYCVNKKVVVGTCPEKMGFLKTGNAGCSFFTSWECLKTSTLHSSCANSTSTDSIIPVINPNEYAYCFHGALYSYHNCPGGLAFVLNQDFLGCTTWEKWNKYSGCF